MNARATAASSLALTRRMRRLRRTPALRGLVRETALAASHFILPLFVVEGIARATAGVVDAWRLPAVG